MRRWRLHRRAVVGGLAATFAAGSVHATGVTIREDQSSRIADDSAYVPPANLKAVLDIYRRMTAPVRINGRGPFPFIVDTGANQSVVSDTLIAMLGLPRGAAELLNGVAGAQMAPTTDARLDIGDRVEVDVTLSVLPEESIGGLGMLGVDRLAGQRLTLDFAHRRLLIEPARRAWRDPDDVVLAAHSRDGQLTLVDADLAGTPVTAFIDSGAQNTIGNLALKAIATVRNPTVMWLETPVMSATGQVIITQMADFPGLRIGGMRLPSWPVAFADLHTFDLWGLTDRPALMIGVDVLSRFKAVSLDFVRDEVRFRTVAMA